MVDDVGKVAAGVIVDGVIDKTDVEVVCEEVSRVVYFGGMGLELIVLESMVLERMVLGRRGFDCMGAGFTGYTGCGFMG